MNELLESSTPWIEAGGTVLVGVLVAALVAALVNLVMRRLLRDARVAGRVAGSVFWVIAGIGVLVGVGRLAEPGATETGLDAAAARLLTALPDVVVGLLVIVLGWAVASAVRTALRQLLDRFRPRVAEVVAPAAFWAVIVLAVLIGADQVGVEVGLLRNLLLLVVAGVVAGAALAVGLGARDLVSDLVAGRHVDRIVQVGDEIEVEGHRGTVAALGHASLRLATPGGELEIPHGTFLRRPVLIVRRAGQ